MIGNGVNPVSTSLTKPKAEGVLYGPFRVVAYFGGYGNGKTYAGCGKLWLQRANPGQRWAWDVKLYNFEQPTRETCSDCGMGDA